MVLARCVCLCFCASTKHLQDFCSLGPYIARILHLIQNRKLAVPWETNAFPPTYIQEFFRIYHSTTWPHWRNVVYTYEYTYRCRAFKACLAWLIPRHTCKKCITSVPGLQREFLAVRRPGIEVRRTIHIIIVGLAPITSLIWTLIGPVHFRSEDQGNSYKMTIENKCFSLGMETQQGSIHQQIIKRRNDGMQQCGTPFRYGVIIAACHHPLHGYFLVSALLTFHSNINK